MAPIKVLIADDSDLMRKVLTDLIDQDPGIQVIGWAANGKETVEAVKKLNPDIITLDLHMPVMDGMEALRLIMDETSKPVIIVSAYTSESAQCTLKALRMGAADYIMKPHPFLANSIADIKTAIISKIKKYGSNSDQPFHLKSESESIQTGG